MNIECPECKGFGTRCGGAGQCDHECFVNGNCGEYVEIICPSCSGTGKQPEAPERIYAYEYDPNYHHYEASSEKRLESDIEYIRKDKAAVCGNCDNIRATLQDKEFCHITGDFPSERICEKWELRK